MADANAPVVARSGSWFGGGWVTVMKNGNFPVSSNVHVDCCVRRTIVCIGRSFSLNTVNCA